MAGCKPWTGQIQTCLSRMIRQALCCLRQPLESTSSLPSTAYCVGHSHSSVGLIQPGSLGHTKKAVWVGESSTRAKTRQRPGFHTAWRQTSSTKTSTQTSITHGWNMNEYVDVQIIGRMIGIGLPSTQQLAPMYVQAQNMGTLLQHEHLCKLQCLSNPNSPTRSQDSRIATRSDGLQPTSDGLQPDCNSPRFYREN